ncbi:unnamed protein product [Caenorhabditis nigoni]
MSPSYTTNNDEDCTPVSGNVWHVLYGEKNMQHANPRGKCFIHCFAESFHRVRQFPEVFLGGYPIVASGGNG